MKSLIKELNVHFSLAWLCSIKITQFILTREKIKIRIYNPYWKNLQKFF